MRVSKAISAGLSVLTTIALLGAPQPATAGPVQTPIAPIAPTASTAPVAGPAGGSYSVTLVTGDRVHVTPRGNGQLTAQVLPAPGRKRMAFRTVSRPGHLQVVPADAARLIAAGRLDARLFDVARLARLGYDDAHTDTVPLILRYSGARALSPSTRGVASSRPLPSIGAEAVQERKSEAGGFWTWLTGGAGADARTLTGGVATVWLDGWSRLADDVSNPQIGAPAAWQAGYRRRGRHGRRAGHRRRRDPPRPRGPGDRGAGLHRHPDGRRRRHGHGTHVASIVAGTGAASDGRYAGVAPERQAAHRQGLRRLRAAAPTPASSPAWSGPPPRAPGSST